MKIKLFLNLKVCFFLFVFTLKAQIPAYYNNIDFSKKGNDLKTQLSSLIIATHSNLIPYTSTSTDTWDVITHSDLAEDNRFVLLIYGYNDTDGIFQTDRTREITSLCNSNSCVGLWNREHVFAKSLATPSLETSSPSAGTDVHNLRAADSQMNSSRNNRIFEEGIGNTQITAQGNFYPGDEWKGDVARIIMYMYLRYPSQCPPNNVALSNNNFNIDMPDIFLKWNIEDPVSTFEINRNDVIASYQGNRNPFIDNPYLATIIWGGNSAIDSWSVLSSNNNIDSTYNDLVIYPNPVNDKIFIINNTNSTIETIIYSLNGKELKSDKTLNYIDVSKLSKGIYFLKLIRENTTQMRKIVKY